MPLDALKEPPASGDQSNKDEDGLNVQCHYLLPLGRLPKHTVHADLPEVCQSSEQGVSSTGVRNHVGKHDTDSDDDKEVYDVTAHDPPST